MNPFKFFTDFVQLDKIDSLKSQFYSEAHDKQYSVNGEWIKQIEFEFDNDDVGYQYTIHFKDYINTLFVEEKIKAFELLDSILFKEASVKDAHKRLVIITTTWTIATQIINGYKPLKKYNLLQYYAHITEELMQKCTLLETGFKFKPKPYNTDIQSTDKILWLGKTNQLITLFYDLMYENTNNGQPYIQSPVGNIAAFIENNFLAKDGKSIPRSSIDTGLKPSKMNKRASGNSRLDITKYSK